MNPNFSEVKQSSTPFIYDRVQFFGRRLIDYEQFFQFDIKELKKSRILDLAAGTASFACEAAGREVDVVAVDPCYRYGIEAVRLRAQADFEEVKQVAESNRSHFNLDSGNAFAQLWKIREEAQKIFLRDFETGRAFGRYRSGKLPHLDFESNSFDEVFCGHFLFLYSNLLDLDFHLAACLEMIRVAKNRVRIYPIIGMDGRRIPRHDELIDRMRESGVKIYTVPLIKNVFRSATEMMILET